MQKLMQEGGEINVLDAKQVDIDSPEMSKFLSALLNLVCWTMKKIFVTTYLNTMIDKHSNGSAILNNTS